MDVTLYNILIDLARNDKLAAYSEVAPLIALDMAREEDRNEIARRLGEIARHEYDNNRPMLTSLIVHYGDDNNPGEGYSSIANELGLYNGSRNAIARLTFWAGQVRDVYNHW
jgi:hypothetical protein